MGSVLLALRLNPWQGDLGDSKIPAYLFLVIVLLPYWVALVWLRDRELLVLTRAREAEAEAGDESAVVAASRQAAPNWPLWWDFHKLLEPAVLLQDLLLPCGSQSCATVGCCEGLCVEPVWENEPD